MRSVGVVREDFFGKGIYEKRRGLGIRKKKGLLGKEVVCVKGMRKLDIKGFCKGCI